MAEFVLVARNKVNLNEKPTVYFTCHPDDFNNHFKMISGDILEAQDCAIYHTQNMSEPLSDEELEFTIGEMNLLVVPITHKLFSSQNRAMDVDIPYAIEHGIRVLPIMMEEGLLHLYTNHKNFGKRQYLSPCLTDDSAIPYEQRLSDYLSDVLIGQSLRLRVLKEFDAQIFLSYRKKDRAYANKLMRFIHSIPEFRDIAIWYDEYITLGEEFDKNIDHELDKSEVFALLVTPSLLEDPNYVKDKEYKAAIGKKKILPIEMVETDRDALRLNYESIPDCVSMETDGLYSSLKALLSDKLKTARDSEPEHKFLIGIAYVYGIDVEVNTGLGLELIAEAAESGYHEAMNTLLEYYSEVVNDNQSAVVWGEKLYQHYLNTLGERDPQTLTAANRLAIMYSALRMYDKAIELNEKTYLTQCEITGEKDFGSIVLLANLAKKHLDSGNAEKALEISQKAYSLGFDVLGENDRITLYALSNLAAASGKAGDHEGALKLCKDAYVLSCDLLGKTDIHTFSALISMADEYKALGELDNALESIEKAYNISLDNYGKDDLRTVVAIGAEISLAPEFRSLGNYKAVIGIYEKAYALYSEVFGKANENTLNLLMCLAGAYGCHGDLENEERCFKEHYDIHRREFGDEDERTLKALESLISLYHKIEDYKSIRKLEERAYKIKCKILGDTHPSTIDTAKMLCLVYLHTSMTSKENILPFAIQFAKKVYQTCLKKLGEGRSETVGIMTALARLYYMGGKFVEAIPLFEKICQLSDEELKSGDPDKLEVLLSLADCYYEVDDLYACLSANRRAYGILKRTRGANDPEAIEVARIIAMLSGNRR